MPRFYHVDLAQYAANADARWVDNLISRFSIPGVEAGGRGLSRRLTVAGIQHIALVRSLSVDFGLPLPQAVPLARSLLANSSSGDIAVGPWLRLSFDRDMFLREVDQCIGDGVEAITPTARGRPPERRR